MSMKHTPGPWHVQSPQPARFPGYTIMNEGNNGYVATVQIRAQNPANANARLIAAAPELLEALNEVLSWTEDDADLMQRLDKPERETWPDTILCRVKFLRDVLAKAEGE